MRRRVRGAGVVPSPRVCVALPSCPTNGDELLKGGSEGAHTLRQSTFCCCRCVQDVPCSFVRALTSRLPRSTSKAHTGMPPKNAAIANLKAACLAAVQDSVDTAKAAGDGRRVIGANRKYPSAKAAEEAKRAAAKARKEAALAAQAQAQAKPAGVPPQ